MSDKRFVLKFDSQENEYFIRDKFEEDEELGSYTLKWGVRKLNEQQATINRLETELKCYKGIIEALERTRVIEVEIPTDKMMDSKMVIEDE